MIWYLYVDQFFHTNWMKKSSVIWQILMLASIVEFNTPNISNYPYQNSQFDWPSHCLPIRENRPFIGLDWLTPQPKPTAQNNVKGRSDDSGRPLNS
jgi:hypothetical protein